MPSFTVHCLTNAAWGAIALTALIWLWNLEYRRFRGSRVGKRLHRLVTVCLLSLAVFPAVSDSDDLFKFSLIPVPGHHDSAGSTAPGDDSHKKSNFYLARILETLDHYQVSGIAPLLPVFCFLTLLAAIQPVCLTRDILCANGRGPPIA